MRFACPHCSASMAADDYLIGQKTKCLKCRVVFIVPSPKPDVDPLAEVIASEAAAEATQPTESEPFTCPFCSGPIKSDVKLVGQMVVCQQCGGQVRMPGNPFLWPGMVMQLVSGVFFLIAGYYFLKFGFGH